MNKKKIKRVTPEGKVLPKPPTNKSIRKNHQQHYDTLVNMLGQNDSKLDIKLINKTIRKLKTAQSKIPGWGQMYKEKEMYGIKYINPLNVKLK